MLYPTILQKQGWPTSGTSESDVVGDGLMAGVFPWLEVAGVSKQVVEDRSLDGCFTLQRSFENEAVAWAISSPSWVRTLCRSRVRMGIVNAYQDVSMRHVLWEN